MSELKFEMSNEKTSLPNPELMKIIQNITWQVVVYQMFVNNSNPNSFSFLS